MLEPRAVLDGQAIRAPLMFCTYSGTKCYLVPAQIFGSTLLLLEHAGCFSTCEEARGMPTNP